MKLQTADQQGVASSHGWTSADPAAASRREVTSSMQAGKFRVRVRFDKHQHTEFLVRVSRWILFQCEPGIIQLMLLFNLGFRFEHPINSEIYISNSQTPASTSGGREVSVCVRV